MRRRSKAPSTGSAAKAAGSVTGASLGITRARRTIFGLACLCVLGLAAFLGSSAPSVGAAEAFPGQGFLPDNRAWEMVSPPDKHGGNIAADSYRAQAAASGDASTFLSTTGFGDVQGTAYWAEYMARRDAVAGTNGWSTHAITPAQNSSTIAESLLGNVERAYQGDLAADLSRGVFLTSSALTEDASAAGAPNLYLRSDLDSPGPGSYGLLTDSLAPVFSLPPLSLLAAGKPDFAAASSDFSHVIFETHLGLTEEGPSAPQLGEVKLYESAAGTVRDVGRIPAEPATSCDDASGPEVQCVQAESSQAGIQGGGVGGNSGPQYSARMISADGLRILFQAPTGAGNIYLREDGTRTFQLNASEKEPPEPPGGGAALWDASRDGSRVFFTTGERLVDGDDDNSTDLYMYEVDKPEGERLTRLSVDNEPVDDQNIPHNAASVIGASDDGHYVYFVSTGQLVAGQPIGVSSGLYLWHDGQISYIGQFGNSTLAGYNDPRAGAKYFIASKTSRVSPDGRHLLFMAFSDAGFKGIGGFGGYDHGACVGYGTTIPACRELYTYDADSGQLRCASCNPSGASATADALVDVMAEPVGPTTTTTHLSHALSEDARYVFFSSAERLVSQDTNGVSDAYVYDTTTEERHLLSSGQDKSGSYFMDASADGRDAFILTAEQLSRWDIDTSYDLYDARVDGGLPEPVPAPPSCQGDACQPAPRELNDPTPSSSSFKAAGNPSAARCPQGKRKVKSRGGKSRCVKRKRHHRTAKNNRRAGR